ncbi:hypothetical protein CPB85DRAFT_705793 [Mucidula mucida]|nr:hypothetical protein CPB85DRAFT_705793 [Mucidula mucida]
MGQSRLFSETDMAQAGTTSTLFARLTDTLPLPKRAKGGGLNTRFDRMVQTMNVTHRSPTRARTRSVGSSSVSSYDLPKTPLDALPQGRLGRDFSVIKMNSGRFLEEDDEMHLQSSPAAKPPPPLPDWLADTFSTLHDAHPLRLLMPDSSRKPPLAHVPDLVQEPVDNENPFTYDIHRGEDHSRPSSHKSAYSHASPKLDIFESPAFIPFTTPGPASTVSTHAELKRPLPQVLTTALSLSPELHSSLINTRRQLPLDSSLLPPLPLREDLSYSTRRSAPNIHKNASSPEIRSAPIFPRYIAQPKSITLLGTIAC